MITCSGNRVEKARICLNAVHVKPYRARAAEEVMIGKEISEAIAEAAGQAAVAGAKPLPENGYMVLMAKALVKKAILACKGHNKILANSLGTLGCTAAPVINHRIRTEA